MLMEEREPWRRVLASLAGYPVVILIVVFLLGTLGYLTAVSVALLLGFIALPVVYVKRRFERSGDGVMPSPPGDLVESGPSSVILKYISVGVLALVLGVFFSKTCLSGTSYFWDDLNYHAAAPAHWLVEQRLSLAPFNYHAYFPFNAEIFSLWFMLPFHADALVSLCCLYWGVLTVVGIIVLSMALGAASTTSVLLAALSLASFIDVEWIITFTVVDLAGPAMILAAIALANPSPGSKATRKSRLVDTLYCGLLSGYAAGSKASFMPVPVILLLWMVLSDRPASGKRVEEVAVFSLSAALTGAYWYVRNILITGSPFFPAKMLSLFDGPFGGWQQDRSKLVSWVLAAPADLQRWEFLVERYFNWPYSLGLLAVIGYGAACFWWLRKDGMSLKKKRLLSGCGLLLLVGLVLILLYPFTPFSGTVDRPFAPLRVKRRFVIAPFAIGMILFSLAVDMKSPWQKFWRLLFFTAAVTTLLDFLSVHFEVRAVAAGCVIFGLWKLYDMALLSDKARRVAGPSLLLTALLALSFWAPYSQKLNDETIYNNLNLPWKWRFCAEMGDAWRYLETLPKGSRIAPFGSADWLYYAVFGRKLQFRPRFLRKHLHEYWRREGTFWDGWIKGGKAGSSRFSWCYTNTDTQVFLEDLLLEEVDYVFVSKEDEETWPYPRQMLGASERVRVIFDNGCAAVYQIIK